MIKFDLKSNNMKTKNGMATKVGGVQQLTGCNLQLIMHRKKKYFNGAHLLDLALND
jgi:hypothetical protein